MPTALVPVLASPSGDYWHIVTRYDDDPNGRRLRFACGLTGNQHYGQASEQSDMRNSGSTVCNECHARAVAAAAGLRTIERNNLALDPRT